MSLTPQQVRQRRLDGLVKAIDWSHVLAWQIERLHAAEAAAVTAELSRQNSGEYRQEDREPFSRLRAEAYFVLCATRQLLRAMQRYGDKKRVPSFEHGEKVLIAVRNAFEHWDGSAPDVLEEHTDVGWDDYTFGVGGTVIAGVLRVDDLARWAEEAQAYLLQAERDWR